MAEKVTRVQTPRGEKEIRSQGNRERIYKIEPGLGGTRLGEGKRFDKEVIHHPDGSKTVRKR